MHTLSDLAQHECDAQHSLLVKIARWKIVLRALHNEGMHAFVQLRPGGPQVQVGCLMRRAHLWTSVDDSDNEANIFTALEELRDAYERSVLMLQFYSAVARNHFEDMGNAHVRLLRIDKQRIIEAVEQDSVNYPFEHPTDALQTAIAELRKPTQFREALITYMDIPPTPPLPAPTPPAPASHC